VAGVTLGRSAENNNREEGNQVMELDAAKMIGAGIAVVGLGGVGAGIGNIFSTTIASLARNPAAQPLIQLPMWVGFALVEAIALYALVVALIILFV
jgi:F-type H+-transporting ATPase subunit c